MKTSEALQYTHENGTVAQWSGGIYIDLGYIATTDGPWNSSKTDRAHYVGDFVAVDVMNVSHLDVSLGQTTLERLVNEKFNEETCHYCGCGADQDEHMHPDGDGICSDCCESEGYTTPDTDDEEDEA